MDRNKEKAETQIGLSEEVGAGVYANLPMVTHSISDFVLDFVRVMPGVSTAPVVSRVVISPETAKQLMHLLYENIQEHEATYGLIRQLDEKSNVFLGGMQGDA